MHTHTSHEVLQAMSVIEEDVHRFDPDVETRLSVYRWNEDDVIDVDLLKGAAEIHLEVSCDRALERSTMEPEALEHDLEEAIHDLNRRAVAGAGRAGTIHRERAWTARQAQDGDRESIARLWSESGFDVPADDEWSRMLDRSRCELLVAENGGAVVGVIVGTFDGQRAYIYRLAVGASHRLGGVGTALVRKAEEVLQRHGVCQIFALVEEGNGPGMAFCTAMGYEPSGEVALVKEVC